MSVALFSLAFTLFAGLMMTRVFKYAGLNFPDVTAFLITGVLLGPFVLGRLGVPGLGFTSLEEVEALGVFSDVALGFIAFDIGNEFRISQMKGTGKAAFVVGVVQAVAATILVDIALVIIHFILGPEVFPMSAVITLGAIASATAPAATLMVVRQYKAKGPLTDILLPIVALDDAVGLIVFAVSFGIARALEGGQLSVITVIVNPLLEIVFSLLLGAVLGVVLTQIEKLFFSNSNRLNMTIAFVFTAIAFSSMEFDFGNVAFSFSPLLVCMMLGTVLCNLCEYSPDIMERAEKWTDPLYAVFFVLSGAELDLSVLASPSVVLIGAVYIVIRAAGKYIGARESSSAMKCPKNVVKYLGITLFPQAGVALGMVNSAQSLDPVSASLIRNVILFSVMVYELAGPMMTRNALRAAGEITPVPESKKNRDRFNKKKA